MRHPKRSGHGSPLVLIVAVVFQALCKTNENRKRLKGIYNLCKRKSAASTLAKAKTSWAGGNPDMSDGIAALGRVVALIENN